MELLILDGLYAVCRLDPGDEIPEWSVGSDFLSVVRSSDELSIVCRQDLVPREIRCNRNLRLLRIAEKLDFGMVGILNRLLQPLEKAGVAVFVVSTYDTDYVMVASRKLKEAAAVLKTEGHRIKGKM